MILYCTVYSVQFGFISFHFVLSSHFVWVTVIFYSNVNSIYIWFKLYRFSICFSSEKNQYNHFEINNLSERSVSWYIGTGNSPTTLKKIIFLSWSKTISHEAYEIVSVSVCVCEWMSVFISIELENMNKQFSNIRTNTCA